MREKRLDPPLLLTALLAASCTPTAPAGTTAPFVGACLKPGCTSDPGWQMADCARAEQGLEFFTPSIVDFETQDSNGNFVGQYMYGYVDGTSNTNATAGYQPQAVAANRCVGQNGNHVFHLYGGP